MLDDVLTRLRAGLARTRGGIISRLDELLGGGEPFDAAAAEAMEDLLLEADIGLDAAERLIEAVRRADERGEKALWDALRGQILTLLEARRPERSFFDVTQRPKVIMVCGANGAGKTTTIGKIAARFAREGRRVLLAASDTFRAAAIDQLEIWARRAHVQWVGHQPRADAASVAFDAASAATARGTDVCIVDTAGRLHTQRNLMDELKKIHRVLGRTLPEAPHEVLLVLDATTGQNALAQARAFHDAVGVTGLALAKLDGTAKGGAVIAIAEALNIPILLVGLGEGLDDLDEFDPGRFTDALLAREETPQAPA